MKYRNGMKGNVMLKHLTHASERNALTRALMGETSECPSKPALVWPAIRWTFEPLRRLQQSSLAR